MQEHKIKISDLDLVNGAEVLQILGLNFPQQLKRLIEKHRIPCVRISRNSIFLRSDIQKVKEFIETKNPRKILELGKPTDIKNLDLIGAAEAKSIFEINADKQMMKLIEVYKVDYKYFPRAYIFYRSEVEKAQNSPERQKNLRHRRKKK